MCNSAYITSRYLKIEAYGLGKSIVQDMIIFIKFTRFKLEKRWKLKKKVIFVVKKQTICRFRRLARKFLNFILKFKMLLKSTPLTWNLLDCQHSLSFPQNQSNLEVRVASGASENRLETAAVLEMSRNLLDYHSFRGKCTIITKK